MNIEKLMQGVSAGDRRALAQAITLVESSRADHRVMATALLDGVATTAATGAAHRPVRHTRGWEIHVY